jgi:hypothetical protein
MFHHPSLGAALLCGTLLSALAGAPPALAAPTPKAVGFFVAPVGVPSLRFQARPGHTVTGSIRVVNLAARTRMIRLTASDLVTADSGGASFPAGRPKSTGTWLQLDTQRVVLTSHGSAKVGFRAVVPDSAEPGQHYAGIVAVDAAEAAAARKSPEQGSGVEVHHLARLALPVRLTLPGAQFTRLAATDMHFSVDASGSSLRVGLRNAGNQIIRETDLDLHIGRDGQELLAANTQIRDFITDSGISYPVAWRGSLQPGAYHVTGTIHPQAGPSLTIDQAVDFTPTLAKTLEQKTGVAAAPGDGPPVWVWALIAALLMAGTAVSVAYLRLRRRLEASRIVDSVPS